MIKKLIAKLLGKNLSQMYDKKIEIVIEREQTLLESIKRNKAKAIEFLTKEIKDLETIEIKTKEEFDKAVEKLTDKFNTAMSELEEATDSAKSHLEKLK